MNWLKLGGLTGLSRILGLVRDIICANIFGASLDFDAFIIAFQIPNFMRRLFAEGALAQAFVPMYNELDAAQQAVFAGSVIGLALLLTSTLVFFAWFFGKALIMLYAPGFSQAGQLQQATTLIKWTMPYISAISIVTICAGIQNSHKKFMLAGAMPLLLNLCLILASQQQNVLILAQAVAVSGCLQAAIMLYFTFDYIGKIQINPYSKQLKRLLKLMLLGVAAAIISQLGSVLDSFLASWLEVGSVSWLYYAQRLVLLPVGVIAVALATVALPELSKFREQADLFQVKLKQNLKRIWCIAWPAAFGLMIVAPRLVGLCFHHGAFSQHSAIITSNLVLVLGFGLPAFMLNKILTVACYAKQDMQLPLKVVSVSLCVNIVLGVLGILYLEQLGIALASVAAAWLQTYLFSKRLNINFLGITEPLIALFMASMLLLIFPLLAAINDFMAILILVFSGVILYEFGLRFCHRSMLKVLYD